MSVIAFCPQCGQPRQGQARFCSNCGAAYPVPASCPTCGQTLPPGHSLASGAPTPAPAMTTTATPAAGGTGDPRLVYGAGFTTSDCVNCGATGQQWETCSVCRGGAN